MKTVLSTRYINIPEGVTVDVKAREVTVKGPKGELKRSFKHLNLALELVDGGKKVRCDLWFGIRKQLACIRTVCSHIENMITGVTVGYKYKMRFVYAHFPINVTLEDNTVEIRNFLGEKRVRKVKLLPGVSYLKSADVKDQIEISGIDIVNVSLTCAQLQQSTTVKRKDIRKFLDGIYVSEKTNIDLPDVEG